MRYLLLVGASVLGLSALGAVAAPTAAYAITCANGVYRAGCAGPNGAVVARKAPPVQRYGASRTVTCANGVYRAGCAGPNGAAVVRKY